MMPTHIATWFRSAEGWEFFQKTIDVVSVERHARERPIRDLRRVDGFAVRIVAEGRLGMASCTAWPDVPAIVRAARYSAHVGPPSVIDFPAPVPLRTVESFDPTVAAAGLEELNDCLDEVVDRAWPARPANARATVRRETTSRRVLNHKGVNADHQATSVTITLAGGTSQGFDMLRTSQQSCRGDFDIRELCDRFVERYERCTAPRDAATSLPSSPDGLVHCVFSESAASALVGIVERVLVDVVNAPTSSVLDELRRRPPVAGGVTIVDRGADDWTPGGAPFDDEGVPKRTFEVIGCGSFRTSIFDLRSAGLKHESPTGNGFRRFDAPPVARFNCPAMEGGAPGSDDLVGELDEGIGIEQLRDVRLRPGAIGDFEARLSAGFLIRRRRPAGSVRGLRLYANVFELLGTNLLATGRAVRRPSWGAAPALLVRNIHVCQ